MTDTDTTFSVDLDTVQQLSTGLVEIDNELVLVKKVDYTTGVATVLGGANGRGREGTAAASHSADALIVSDPMFPKSVVAQACLDSINGTFPDLYVVANTTFTKSAPVFEYEMPSTSFDVVQVYYDTVGPSRINPPAAQYRFNSQANTTRFPSGKSIQVLDNITPGRDIKVTYYKAPGLPSADGDDMATLTGWDSATVDRYSDMFVYGAVARLLPAYESARLQQGAIESNERANLVPTSAATKTSQFYWQMYRARVAEERNRLQQLNESGQYWRS